MKLIWAATIATGMLATQGASASSMLVLAPIEPANAGSIVYLGEPAVVPALPDSSIVTAAFGADGDQKPARSGPAIVRGPGRDAATAPAWPPRTTRSMIVRGTPLPEKTTSPDGQAPSLRAAAPIAPMVIRGGLVGDAFPTLSEPPLADDYAPSAPPAAAPVPAIVEEGEHHLSRRQQRREERREERGEEPMRPAPTVELPPPAAPTGLPM
jgi:hypothetical protein